MIITYTDGLTEEQLPAVFNDLGLKFTAHFNKTKAITVRIIKGKRYTSKVVYVDPAETKMLAFPECIQGKVDSITFSKEYNDGICLEIKSEENPFFWEED